MNMYERIVKLAERKGVAIAQVERDLGFSKGSLRKMQTNQPSSDRIVSLAKYFDVSTDYLYGTTQIEKTADKLLDMDFVRLQRARQNMSKEEWKQAMTIIQAGFSSAFEDQ